MVEENKKMLKVENEVVKKPTAPEFPGGPPSKYYPGRGMVVDTIHCSAVAIALLRFGPFVRSLLAIVSCSVMERGAGSG